MLHVLADKCRPESGLMCAFSFPTAPIRPVGVCCTVFHFHAAHRVNLHTKRQQPARKSLSAASFFSPPSFTTRTSTTTLHIFTLGCHNEAKYILQIKVPIGSWNEISKHGLRLDSTCLCFGMSLSRYVISWKHKLGWGCALRIILPRIILSIRSSCERAGNRNQRMMIWCSLPYFSPFSSRASRCCCVRP
jgi:hypothetical protein